MEKEKTDDFGKRLVEEVLADINAEKAERDKGMRARSAWQQERAQSGFKRVQGLLAIRSGFEKAVQETAIEELAKQEFTEASNGLRN